MTGYGTARGAVGRTFLSVEVRSVNHRFCEANIRMPGRLSFLEQEIAGLVRRRFERGKFDLFIREESADPGDLRQFLLCLQLLKKIQRQLRLKGEIGLAELLSFWQVYGSRHPADEMDAARMRKPLFRLIGQGLGHLEKMRSREGNHLKKWFEGRLRHLTQLLRYLDREAKWSEQLARQKMQEGESEPASDVTEEMVRLKSHVIQVRKTIGQAAPCGRRLDFLAQEMVREINTLGSKIDGVKAVQHVIDFKTELEKLREQIQNVE